eukprot:10357557-Prorocentrum_lima.AAC.1
MSGRQAVGDTLLMMMWWLRLSGVSISPVMQEATTCSWIKAPKCLNSRTRGKRHALRQGAEQMQQQYYAQVEQQ